MVLTAEHAQALSTVLAALLGGAIGWWLLAPWARRNLRTGGRPVADHAAADPAVARADQGAAASAPDTRAITARSRGSDRGPSVAAAASTGVVWGLTVWRTGPEPVLPALLAFAAGATVLAFVDVIEQRLPNRVLLPTAAVVAALLVVASAVADDWGALAWAALGGGGMFALYLAVALISPAAMGMGDVKLAGLIGALLGWFGLGAWMVGLLGAFVLGGVVAVGAVALRRVTLREAIPFGPSMLAAALLAVLAR
jgi:leader peptidase (prepilin peptidase)/N-methyltransferase